jgi:hypothetical protein
MSTQKQVDSTDGEGLDDSFGSLSAFAESEHHLWLVSKQNNSDDYHHLNLYEFCVIGSEVHAEHDVV